MNLYQQAAVFLNVVSGEYIRAAMAKEPPRHNALVTTLEQTLTEVAAGAHQSAFQVLIGLAEGNTLHASTEAEKQLIDQAQKAWTKIASAQLKGKVASIEEGED